MRRLTSLLLSAAVLASGCAVTQATESPKAKEGAVLYVDPARVDSTRFLAPPPDAQATSREIDVLLDLQSKRTPQQTARSVADLEQSVFRFADVLGPKFAQANLPVAAKFFHQLYKTESAFNKQGKDRWARQRPPVLDKRVQPVAKYSNSGSYPSGHAAFAYLTAIALADMVPEKRAQIFERAREFGDNRVLGGVHYPSDIEAGRQLAVLIAAHLPDNPTYVAEFSAAKAEVRRVLDLR